MIETTIIKGGAGYLDDCVEALQNSELGRQYFSRPGSARSALAEGFEKGKIYVALAGNTCAGFMWFIINGIFHACPYLHIIAVKQQYRGQGIGSRLLRRFEDLCSEGPSRLLLVVADFNPAAKALYERTGYTEVGALPGLYKAGVTEYLMMKVKDSTI